MQFDGGLAGGKHDGLPSLIDPGAGGLGGDEVCIRGREVAERGSDQTVAITELDTLLHDIQSDLIDERTIKEAWKAAAADAGDMGGDSILKAIAAAERDLQIGAPEPVQTAMDTALDDELLTVPNLPAKKPQRG